MYLHSNKVAHWSTKGLTQSEATSAEGIEGCFTAVSAATVEGKSDEKERFR